MVRLNTKKTATKPKRKLTVKELLCELQPQGAGVIGSTGTTTIAIRVPISLKEELSRIADKECRDLSHQVIYMLREAIGRVGSSGGEHHHNVINNVINRHGRSMGTSEALASTIFPINRAAKLLHFVYYFKHPGGERMFSLVSQITLVGGEKDFIMQLDQSPDSFISGQGLSDVVDLSAFKLTAWVWKKEDLRNAELLWHEVDESAVIGTPNGVEFSFYHNFRPFPDCPAEYLFSTVSDNMLWHDIETFIDFCVLQRLDLDIERRLVRDNGFAEMQNGGC